MTYELAKLLKDSGFPQDKELHNKIGEGVGICKCERFGFVDIREDCNCKAKDIAYQPTLEELISACGDEFGFLYLNPENGMWLARERGIEPIHPELNGHKHYETRKEAVAKLYIELNKKSFYE